MSDNKEWVKSWVERYNREDRHGLNEKEIDKAATIGESMFKGNVGVGHAAEAGIDAVKKLRD